MVEIRVQSGFKSGRTSILNANQVSIIRALAGGVITAANQVVPNMPRDTGKTQQGARRGIIKSGSVSVTKQGNTFILKGEDVYRLMRDNYPSNKGYKYPKKHTVQDPDFVPGQNYQGGKSAIDINKVMAAIHKNVRSRLTQDQRNQGLDAR